jgi:penicillin-binding protein 1A
MARTRKRPRRQTKGRRITAAHVLRAVLALVVVGVGVGLGTLAWLWPRCTGDACPSVAGLRDYTPPQASRVFDGDGRLLAHLAPERRQVVPLSRIPAHVSGAFLAVEDKRFYRHRGVDYRRVGGALARNARTLRWNQGFSTVTMQLARNVFPEHLSRAKTLRRKLWEVVLAREIEREFRKEQILEMYLNQIYLGAGLYGVEAAAQGYFGKPAARLTDAEAALLAALPRLPHHYDPRRNPTGAHMRRDLVLGLMADAGVVTAEAAERARAEPLGLAPPAEATGTAPYFIAAVRRELVERFGPDAETAGLRVYTRLDPALQKSAEEALLAQIHRVERGEAGRFRHRSCAGTRPDDPAACLQGMFVALDPHTGHVLALVGGRDFATSQFDRATQARRQAGSAFKPLVYAAALEQGVPISTALLGPGAIGTVGSYRPADHVSDEETLDLRGSLRVSSNRAAVVLGEHVGVATVADAARRLGITTPVHLYPSTFLGAAEVIPVELVAAYAAFANGGRTVKPSLLRRVEDSRGRVVYEHRLEGRQAISPEAAFLTTSLMRDVVDHGTARSVRAAGLPYGVPAAGKTGTTNEAADVWFVGATPDVVAGVWLGFDRPQRILANTGGGGLAAPVWGRAMAEHYQRRAHPPEWTAPSQLVTARVDRTSGALATPECPEEGVTTEYFIAGTEPVEYCHLHPEHFGNWFGRTLRGIGGWITGRRGDN